MNVDVAGKGHCRGDGLKTYYRGKIEELEMQIREKHLDLRRMEAQRNELNAKGEKDLPEVVLVFVL